MTETSIDELSEAFHPCTLSGLADEWSRLNRQIAADRKERDVIGAILLEASCKAHNNLPLPFREGSVIEGKDVKVKATWRLVDGGDPPKWEAKLEYVR